MIEKVKLENYKGFRNLDIDGFKQVTLIGGMNNIGKTSLLESIFMFYDRNNPNMLLNSFGWRGIPNMSSDAESLWNPLFNNYDSSKTFSINIKEGNKEEILSSKITPIQNSSLPINKNINLENFNISNTDNESNLGLEVKFTTAGKKNPEKIEFWINNGHINIKHHHGAKKKNKSAKFLPSNILSLHDDAIDYGKIDKIGKEQEIVEVLKIIEPRLKSLSVISINPQASLVFGDIGLAEKVPISCMGDGIRRLLSIIVKIMSNENGLVLIDEIENGLHHSIMSDIWKGIAIVANKVNCQVIATTHSYECLQAASKGTNEFKDDFSYVRLEQNKKGVLSSKTLSHELLETAVKNSWEVR